MEILSKLPERLKELMLEKEIKAPALAQELHLTSATITRYMQVIRIPKMQTLLLLVDYFNCSTDYLLGLIDYPRQENQVFKQPPPFATQFRNVMKKCNTTQYALQKKTKISWANFNAWLNGTRLPLADSLVKLAHGLDCSVDFLLGRED